LKSMVFFTCDACGESLKKNQVEKHYNFKCRRCSVLTCVDCQKDFPGDAYKEHTKCITEDEKYGGKNYQPKANAMKGQKKQNAWIENLQDLVKARSAELDSDVKSVVSTIVNFDNVPRKKAKFVNFAKNVLGGGRRSSPQTLDKTWELLEQALKKPKAEEQAEANESKKKDEETSAADEQANGEAEKENVKKDEEMTNGTSQDYDDEDSSSKKSKKKKRKAAEEEQANGKKKDDTSADEQANHGEAEKENVNDTDDSSSKKSKKKKRKADKEDKDKISAKDEIKQETINGTEEVVANGDSDEAEEEVNQGVTKFKGTKGSVGVTATASNGDSDKSSKKKKRKAEDKEANNSKSESEKEDSTTPMKKEKKQNNDTEEVVNGGSSAAPFDWEGVAVAVLTSKQSGGASSQLKLKKLKRKVMIRYFDHIGTQVQLSDEEKQKLESKFEKKVNKSDQFSVKEEIVSLKKEIVDKLESSSSSAAKTKKKKKQKEEGEEVKDDSPADKELKEEVANVLDGLKKEMDAEIANGGGAQSFNQWETANLGDDGANEKFRRLMGLGKKAAPAFNGGVGAAHAGGGFKQSSSPGNSWQGFKHTSSVADRDQVNKMFSQQEEQFKRAVGAKRGMGFGFAEEQQKPKNKKITFDD